MRTTKTLRWAHMSFCWFCYEAAHLIWTASSEFGTYRLCEQRRFRRACAFAQSHQNLRCSPIQAMSQEEPSNRKPDPWPLWMAGHAQLKCVMTECSKTKIRLTGLICYSPYSRKSILNVSFVCYYIYERYLLRFLKKLSNTLLLTLIGPRQANMCLRGFATS